MALQGSITAAPKRGKSGKGLVSIVFSFRNEADVLVELIERLTAVFDAEPVECELVFVNDDSEDGSLELLTAARVDNPGIKILNMSRRFGYADCLRAGLKQASGDAIITMDTDLQDPPEVIPKLLAEWRNGAEVVYTIRSVRKGEPPFRLLATWAAYRIIRSFSHIPLPVDAGDFRLMSRRAADEFLRLDETNPYLRGLAIWVGFKRVPVYYKRDARQSGKSHFPGTFSMDALQCLVAGITSFSMVPLFFVFVLGLVATAGSVLGLLATLFGAPLPDGSAMVLFMLFLWGSLMAATGVLAVYISLIYSDVRRRPGCIIKDTIGFDSDGS